jgi:peptidoglycan-associated lipoprotein
MIKNLAVVLLALSIAACSSTPTQDAAPIEDSAAAAAKGAPGTTTTGTSTTPIAGTSTGAGAAGNTAVLKDPANILSTRIVLFDYDQFVVKDQYRPLVEAHAKYLQANRAARVTLQGHTDERGTREYNIALGQKRSDAVKRMLVLLGAQEVQIETVSFGKEKPKAMGSDESAWSQNRRVEIVYASD